MSQAAAYGATAAAVSGVSGSPGAGSRAARRLDDRDGVVGVDRAEVLVDGDAARRRDAAVRRLVDALPHPEARVALERVDDPVEQRLLREVAVDAGETEPQLQPVRRRGVELLRRPRAAARRAPAAPDGVVADVRHPGGGDLGPRARAARAWRRRRAADSRARSETPALPSTSRVPVAGSSVTLRHDFPDPPRLAARTSLLRGRFASAERGRSRSYNARSKPCASQHASASSRVPKSRWRRIKPSRPVAVRAGSVLEASLLLPLAVEAG